MMVINSNIMKIIYSLLKKKKKLFDDEDDDDTTNHDNKGQLVSDFKLKLRFEGEKGKKVIVF